MIKSISIQNIQCHHEAKLDFHPGVNMIIGPSDNGKSALFNALYKIIQNKPAGDEWRTWSTNESTIEMVIDHYQIKYTKGKQASYSLLDLNQPNKPELIYKAFGQSIPEEIQQIFNMDNKINIQRQLERGVPIFLIAESPGEVAKHFNSVAGLDIIDSSILKGKQQIKSTKNQLENVKIEKNEKQDKLKKYKLYVPMELKVQRAESQEIKIQEKLTKEKTLSGIVKDIKDKKIQLEILSRKLKLNPNIKQAGILYNILKEKQARISLLKEMLGKIINQRNTLKFYNKKLLVSNKIKKGQSLFQQIEEKSEKIKKLKSKIESIFTLEEQVKKARIQYKELKLKFKEIMPTDFCPLCGGDLK